MPELSDIVHLSPRHDRWPVELAERILANPLPFDDNPLTGTRVLKDGIWVEVSPSTPNQGLDFHQLAICVDGGYDRHTQTGGWAGDAWQWALETLKAIEVHGSCTPYTTQDLLDIPFLLTRLDRFGGGHVLAAESQLRLILTEVVRRVQSTQPPIFLQ